MRPHHIFTIFALFLALTSMAYPPKPPTPLHTGTWNRLTPNVSEGETIECGTAKTKREMVNALKNAGWNMKSGIPNIDWRSNQATIIAKDEDMKFQSLFRRNGKIILYYQILEPSDGSYSSGGTRISSSTVPSRSIIVVSYPKNIMRDNNFFCEYNRVG